MGKVGDGRLIGGRLIVGRAGRDKGGKLSDEGLM